MQGEKLNTISSGSEGDGGKQKREEEENIFEPGTSPAAEHVHRGAAHSDEEDSSHSHECGSNFEGKTTRFIKQNYLERKNMSEEERKKWFKQLTNEIEDDGSCFRCSNKDRL